MYKNGAPMFPLPKHYENHLVKMLVDGDAIIIEKSKSLFTPFVEMFSSAVSVAALQSNKIDDTCQPFGLFFIRYEHYPKGRKFQLDGLNTGPNFNDSKHVLQVVAQTDKPEKVLIEYEKESCTNGNKDCPTIIIFDGGEYKNQKTTTTPFDLSVKPYNKKTDLSFFDFLQTYLIADMRDLEPEIYRIKTSCCSDVDNYNAEVHCYPTLSFAMLLIQKIVRI
jgi:hypothetical protein